jgi:hypothetical protein
MTTPGGTIEPEHLSSDSPRSALAGASSGPSPWAAGPPEAGTLAENIEKVERTIIAAHARQDRQQHFRVRTPSGAYPKRALHEDGEARVRRRVADTK